MRKKQMDLFFKQLSECLDLTCDVILLGASAGRLMGNIRPSKDIDFEITLRGKQANDLREKMQAAVEQTSKLCQIEVNYSEFVGGWSRIDFLDYRESAIPYKTFGTIHVKVISPGHWTIGKMGRFLRLDVNDMLKIIRSKGLKPQPLISLWARAIKKSPLSLEVGQFRDHVVYFLKHYGKSLWGSEVDPAKLVNQFQRKISR
jgi:hypothetical protein